MAHPCRARLAILSISSGVRGVARVERSTVIVTVFGLTSVFGSSSIMDRIVASGKDHYHTKLFPTEAVDRMAGVAGFGQEEAEDDAGRPDNEKLSRLFVEKDNREGDGDNGAGIADGRG